MTKLVATCILTLPLVLSATDAAELPRTAKPTINFVRFKNPSSNQLSRINQKLVQIRADENREYDAIWLGDSITHFWEERWTGGPKVFADKFAGYRIFNAGIGGAKTQEVLWYITRGGFLSDGIKARVVQLMVGTNNVWDDSPEDIASGIAACVREIRAAQPEAKVLLLSVLPREVAHVRGGRDYTKNRPEGVRDQVMAKQTRVNELIRPLADGEHVIFVDLTSRFTDKEDLPDITLYADGTHPNAAGYTVMADALLPIYRQILASKPE